MIDCHKSDREHAPGPNEKNPKLMPKRGPKRSEGVVTSDLSRVEVGDVFASVVDETRRHHVLNGHSGVAACDAD